MIDKNILESASLAVFSKLKKHGFSGCNITLLSSTNCSTFSYGKHPGLFAKKIKASDKFYIYSLTKLYLAVLVHLIFKENELTITQSINRWINDLPYNSSISVKQLLQHTSGITNYSEIEQYQIDLSLHPGASWKKEQFLGFSCRNGLEFEPGSQWSYSNTGYMLVKLILERITGLSFTQLIQKYISTPLKLSNTFVMEGFSLINKITPGYLLKDGDFLDILSTYDPNWVGHGLIASNSEEVSQFVYSIFNGIISPELPEFLKDFIVIPKSKIPVKIQSFENQPAYGLGIMSDPKSAYGPWYGHGGEGPGYSSFSAYLEQFSTVVTVLCNCDAYSAHVLFHEYMTHLTKDF